MALFTFFFSSISSKTKDSAPYISGDSAKHTLCHPSKRAAAPFRFCVYFSSWRRVRRSVLLSYQNCGGGKRSASWKKRIPVEKQQ
jgi:hypothetical protein